MYYRFAVQAFAHSNRDMRVVQLRSDLDVHREVIAAFEVPIMRKARAMALKR